MKLLDNPNKILNVSVFVIAEIIFHPSERASAQFSPGELSRSHQKLEGAQNCTQCHEIGKEISGQKCLGCHEEIKTSYLECFGEVGSGSGAPAGIDAGGAMGPVSRALSCGGQVGEGL